MVGDVRQSLIAYDDVATYVGFEACGWQSVDGLKSSACIAWLQKPIGISEMLQQGRRECCSSLSQVMTSVHITWVVKKWDILKRLATLSLSHQ